MARISGSAGWSRRRWVRIGRAFLVLFAALAILISFFMARATTRPEPAAPAIPVVTRAAVVTNVAKTRPPGDVWQVETRGNAELYSNGLHIDNSYTVSNRPRSYLVFPAAGGSPIRRSAPAGIVFHSTESQQAPFEAGHNEALKKIGESLLDYIRRRRSYHFVIDRFGRVYRVVAENDSAHHAGFSVWADQQWLYVNLNESFLGIALEARTSSGQSEPEISAAQTRSAVMLTEMLRARYRIPAANCVTHGQVSVNPSNLRIGYHVDWASAFPFEELGLPDNYAIPLPSIWIFGFEWDATFLNTAGTRMRIGVEAAAGVFNQRASAAGMGAGAYRKQLQQQYRQKLAAVRHLAPPVEAEGQ